MGHCLPAAIMRGFFAGYYHLPSMDLGNDLLAHAVGGAVPKGWPLTVDVILMPVMAVATRAFRWYIDSVVRKHAWSRSGDGVRGSERGRG